MLFARSRRRPSVARWHWRWCAFLTFQTAVQALINPVKEMGEMTMEVSRETWIGPIPAYLPAGQSNEVVFGMINFKLGRRVLP